MQIEFEKNTLECLQRVAWETRQEEQTQEIKVPDSMPDIGTVLGAWGQPVLRSKTWHGSGMTAAGGVMVWILYIPEEESMPRMVEGWIPYQVHWDFPQTRRDGTMVIRTQLQDLDARSVSPRKLMLRGVISVAGEALEPVKTHIYTPPEMPEDVQILRKSYPVCVPKEAGEKAFLMEEELSLPASCAGADKLMYYGLQPEITDQKIMADKIVFRGSVRVHGLCRCGEEKLETFSLEVPFSQYAELERPYSDQADPMLMPEVSNAELELLEDGSLHLKAGIVGQYVIVDRPVIELVEDAYSPTRSITPQWEDLQLPAVLEQRQDILPAEQTIEAEAARVIDQSFYTAHPAQLRIPEGIQLQQPARFRVLWQDPEGTVHSDAVDCPLQLELRAAPQTQLLPWTQSGSVVKSSQTPGQLCLYGEAVVHTLAVAEEKFPMMTALEIGQPVEPDPERPSLILRRVGQDSLWQIAKQYGSTMDAITQANALNGEPEPESILLIPVS